MDLNIRNAVISNMQNSTFEELYQTINDASNTKEENILPGLGVFFELLWKSSTNEEKNTIADKIARELKK